MCSFCTLCIWVVFGLGDSLRCGKSGFVLRRQACMLKEWNQSRKLLFRNWLKPIGCICVIGEERRATIHCSSAELEMRNVAQGPVSWGEFLGCETQPQREEINSSCKEEPVSQRGLNYNHTSLSGVSRLLCSASLQSVCSQLQVPFRYS